MKFSMQSDNVGVHKRRRGANDLSTFEKTPPPKGKGYGFRRVTLSVSIAIVMLTSIAIFGYLAFGPELQRALERFDFTVFYASLTRGKQNNDQVFTSSKGN